MSDMTSMTPEPQNEPLRLDGERLNNASLDGRVDPECEHRLAIDAFRDAESGIVLWACRECRRRFYPACSTCVDVGHRNVVHPAAAPATGRRETLLAVADELALHPDTLVSRDGVVAILRSRAAAPGLPADVLSRGFTSDYTQAEYERRLAEREATYCVCGDYVLDSSGDAGCGNCGADYGPRDPDDVEDALAAADHAERPDAPEVYAAAMLTAWRTTKDFLRDRLLTSGRSDVSINAVLRVMNDALNEPSAADHAERGLPLREAAQAALDNPSIYGRPITDYMEPGTVAALVAALAAADRATGLPALDVETLTKALRECGLSSRWEMQDFGIVARRLLVALSELAAADRAERDHD